jgi:2'-5' RNA ligase
MVRNKPSRRHVGLALLFLEHRLRSPQTNEVNVVMESLRCFVAILPDPLVLAAIEKSIAEFKRFETGVRWVARDSIHLTLAFLGDVVSTRLPELCDYLQMSAERHTSFELELIGVGAFPNIDRPRVVWVGCGAGLEPCKSLQAEIDDAVQALGYRSDDRPFEPHWTIGRVKTSTSPRFRARLADLQSHPFGIIPVSEIVLMSSVISRDYPPIYSIVSRHALS